MKVNLNQEILYKEQEVSFFLNHESSIFTFKNMFRKVFICCSIFLRIKKVSVFSQEICKTMEVR
jgi:hypothetical protein